MVPTWLPNWSQEGKKLDAKIGRAVAPKGPNIASKWCQHGAKTSQNEGQAWVPHRTVGYPPLPPEKSKKNEAPTKNRHVEVSLAVF